MPVVSASVQPTLRYRIGQPLLRLLITNVLDRVAPQALARLYGGLSPRRQQFLLGHDIYAPSKSIARTWTLKTIGGGALSFSDQARPLRRELGLRYSLHEIEVKLAIEAICRASQRPWVVDGGANLGHMSFGPLAMGKQVLAVEADPVTAAMMRALFDELGFREALVEAVALAAVPGQREFARSSSSYLSHLIDAANVVSPDTERFLVHCQSLDLLLAERGIAPTDVSILKLDLEGGEYDALLGSSLLLEQGRPSLILELLTDEGRASAIAMLADLGYQCFVPKMAGAQLKWEKFSRGLVESEGWVNYCFLQSDIVAALSIEQSDQRIELTLKNPVLTSRTNPMAVPSLGDWARDRMYRLLRGIRPAFLADAIKRFIGVERMEMQVHGMRFLVDPVTNLGQSLILNGEYEPAMRETIERFVPSGGMFLDAGANEGYFTVFAAMRGARVIAFEPQSRLQSVIADHLQINGLSDRVSVRQCALGARSGSIDLRLTPTTNSGATGFANMTRYKLPVEEVALRMLDDEIKALGVTKVDLLKIDVEGAEYELLCGASRSLSSGVIDAVALELHPAQLLALGSSSNAVLALLESHGFQQVADAASLVFQRRQSRRMP